MDNTPPISGLGVYHMFLHHTTSNGDPETVTLKPR